MSNFDDPVNEKTEAMECVFDRIKSNYSITFIIICIFLPAMIIFISYFKIFRRHYKIKANLLAHQNPFNESMALKKNAQSIRLAKSLCISFGLFVICW